MNVISVSAIVTGLILALFTYWLNRERFDLRFTLSEKIPLRFGSGTDEAVQQIEVKNLSKKPVEKIQVKLPPSITTFEFFKYSQADQPEHFKNPESEEFIYPTLPPDASFRIVFKTPGAGIAKDQVKVTHSRGAATYALESGQSLFALAYLVPFAFWCVLCLFSFRSTLVDSWNWDAEYRAEQVLKRSIPFYMPGEKWEVIRAKAIQNLVGREFLDEKGGIEDLTSCKWLNREKPDYLSNEEWNGVRNNSTERFLSTIRTTVGAYWRSDQFLWLLRIKKPLQLSTEKWVALQAEFQEKYLDRRLTEPMVDLYAKLQEPKPDGIDQAKWNENQAKFASRLAAQIFDQASYQQSPLAYVNKQKLSVLPPESSEWLIKKAYSAELAGLPAMSIDENAQKFLKETKPEWMKPEDYAKYKAQAERTIGVTKRDALNSLLELIVKRAQLPAKQLEGLEPDLQEKLKKIDEEIRVASERNRSDSTKTLQDRESVLKQLKILNDLLADPTSIDRVESYDNPFAPGNFELLKKVSRALRTAHQN